MYILNLKLYKLPKSTAEYHLLIGYTKHRPILSITKERILLKLDTCPVLGSFKWAFAVYVPFLN